MSSCQPDSGICLEINKVFNLVKSKMLSHAINQGKGRPIYQDAFTGRILWTDDPIAFGYVYSPQRIYETYENLLDEQQMAQVINCPSNVIVTQHEALESLKDQNPEQWLNQLASNTKFGIDLAYAVRIVNKAKLAIAKTAEKYLKR